VGYGAVGIALAWAGLGVHALVAAWLVQAAVALLASLAACRHPVKPLLWYERAGQTLATGQAVFLTNLVNWSLANLDRVLIGRLLGTWSLGLYNVAYNLASVPNSVMLGALQPAFLAAGAQMQGQGNRLAQAYLQMLAALLVVPGSPVQKVEVIKIGDDFRVVAWPYPSRAAAERAQAALLARGHRLQLIDF
jgi:O-antigen/teichoic acid export membrane protein